MSKQDKKIFAFVVYPSVTLLDLVATHSVLGGLPIGSPYRTVIVGERAEPIVSDSPLKVIPQLTFADVPQPWAFMIVGGHTPASLHALANPVIRNYVQSAAATADLIGAVDSGTLVLAAAGLLQGRPATTHWSYAKLLERLGARYVRKPWVEDGRFITAAGVSGAMDMALYLLSKLRSRNSALLAQALAEYDPHPPFGGIDWNHVNADEFDPNCLTSYEQGDLKRAFDGQPDLFVQVFDHSMKQ